MLPSWMQTAASIGMAVRYILLFRLVGHERYLSRGLYLVRLALHLCTQIKPIVSLGRGIQQVDIWLPSTTHTADDVIGFSRDVCAILLIANITRCFYWLGDRFEFALLIQSLLMIMAQVRTLCWQYFIWTDFWCGESFYCFTFVFDTGLGYHQNVWEHHLDLCLSGSGQITGTTSNSWPLWCDYFCHVPTFGC